ncbi:hypothetical protein [Mucilaginibacter sp. UYCu711]|uniref:hypothetical protein n=1 Tax=Mucilaginibacter sp. UYCu711 TaxID=3156339 RepID=UPI003D1C8C3C
MTVFLMLNRLIINLILVLLYMPVKNTDIPADPIVHIAPQSHKIIVSAANEWGMTKKEYVDFCVKFCSELKLDPTNYSSAQTRAYKKKISSINQVKNLESSLIDRVAETRNTVISFIKQMEKEKLDVMNKRLIALDLKQLKNQVMIIDLLSQLLADNPKMQKEMFANYVKKLNA